MHSAITEQTVKNDKDNSYYLILDKCSQYNNVQVKNEKGNFYNFILDKCSQYNNVPMKNGNLQLDT